MSNCKEVEKKKLPKYLMWVVIYLCWVGHPVDGVFGSIIPINSPV